VLLVMLRHSWPGIFGGSGIVGVVIFFTLSGYLITGLLTRDLGTYGKVRYGRFYLHRALRLVPALILLLVVFAVVEGVFNLTGARGDVPRSLAVGITYTMDIPFDHGSRSLSHLWTLAVEEQFYLVWPVLLTVAIVFRRVPLVLISTGAVLMLVLLASLFVSHPTYEHIYTLPSTWTISMVIGAAARLGRAQLLEWWERNRARRAVLISAASVVLLALSVLPDAKNVAVMYVIGGPGIGVATMILIFALGKVQRIPSRPARSLLHLGTISYATYLWNWPVYLWLSVHLPAPVASAVAPIVTVAAAIISWFLIEKPLSDVRRRIDKHMRATLR